MLYDVPQEWAQLDGQKQTILARANAIDKHLLC